MSAPWWGRSAAQFKAHPLKPCAALKGLDSLPAHPCYPQSGQVSVILRCLAWPQPRKTCILYNWPRSGGANYKPFASGRTSRGPRHGTK